MRFSKMLFTLALAFGSTSVPAGAATFIVNETIDLELVNFSGFVNWQQPLTTNVVPVFDGDTIDTTMNFAGNQSLRIDQGGAFGLLLSMTLGSGTEITPSNVSVEFFGLVTNGPFVNGANVGNQQGGFAEGRNFFPGDLGIEADGSFFQFSGMRMVFDIALVDDAPNLGFGRMDMIARNATLVETSVIPIPATAWLFAAGLAGLVGISRRKKAA